MVEGSDLLLLEKTQDPLLECARTLARNDLDEGCLLGDRLVDDCPQRAVDVTASVVDVVQVELQLHGRSPRTAASTPKQPRVTSSATATSRSSPRPLRASTVPTS